MLLLHPRTLKRPNDTSASIRSPHLTNTLCRESNGKAYAAKTAGAASVSPDPQAGLSFGLEPPTASRMGGPERPLLEADALATAIRAALLRVALPLACAARRFVKRGGWNRFGYARLDDHARERFKRSGRWVRDLAGLAKAIDFLPGLGRALTGEDGRYPLGKIAAIHIGRVASPASVDAWISVARRVTFRELRKALKAARESGSAWPPGVEPDTEKRANGAAEPPSSEGLVQGDGAPASGPDDDLSERHLIRLFIPEPVRAAFDEALALYRAVVGSEATVTSFVEALAAEAAAGPGPAEIEPTPSASRLARAAIEEAFARSSDHWKHLRSEASDYTWGLALAGHSLARLEQLERRAGKGDARELDDQIRELIELEEALETRLGWLLAEMGEQGAWSTLRFAGVGHYGEERLGLSRGAAEDRARLARAFRRFRHLRRAHEEGRVGRESAQLVARVLGPGPVDEEIERAWVRRAWIYSVKRLRDDVNRRRGRDWPAEPSSRAKLPPDDAELHASLRRGPGTALERVERFGRETVASLGFRGFAPLPLDTTGVFHPSREEECRPRIPEIVSLRLRLPEEIASPFLAAIESYRRGLSDAARELEDPPELPPSLEAARAFATRAQPLPAWVGLLAILEEFVSVWDDPRAMPRRPGDEIYIRDGWRCTAPGCTSRCNLEDHHVVYRSHGGSDDLSNRICLCRFHHQRGEHGNLASCHGSAPLGIVWRLGRDDVAARFRNERRLEVDRSEDG